MKRLIVRALWLAFLTTLTSVPAAQAGIRDVVNGSGKAAMVVPASTAQEATPAPSYALEMPDVRDIAGRQIMVPVRLTSDGALDGVIRFSPISAQHDSGAIAVMRFFPETGIDTAYTRSTAEGLEVGLSTGWSMKRRTIGYLMVVTPKPGTYQCRGELTASAEGSLPGRSSALVTIETHARGTATYPAISIPSNFNVVSGEPIIIPLSINNNNSPVWGGEIRIRIVEKEAFPPLHAPFSEISFEQGEGFLASFSYQDASGIRLYFAAPEGASSGLIGRLSVIVPRPGSYEISYSGGVLANPLNANEEIWFSSTAPLEVYVLPGDLSLNGHLSAWDAVLYMEYLFDPLGRPLNEHQSEALDLDRDGRATLLDIVVLLRRAMRLPELNQLAGKAADIHITPEQLEYGRQQLAEIAGINTPAAERVRELIRSLIGSKDDATRVADAEAVPGQFRLGQNYPNPFNPATTINYDIAEPGDARLAVYNAAGQLVETLRDGFHDAGSYTARWNAGNLGNGTYFYVLEAGGFRGIGRMVLLK